MKKVSLLLLTLTFVLFITSQASAAQSRIAVDNFIAVSYIGTGGSLIPWKIGYFEVTNIDGTSNSSQYTIGKYDIYGHIIKPSGCPISMTMTHSDSNIYINNIKVKTFYSSDLTKYSVLPQTNWIQWTSYGYKSGLSGMTYDNWNVGKVQVNAWWKGSDTIPVNYYPSNNHTFWNYGWLNN